MRTTSTRCCILLVLVVVTGSAATAGVAVAQQDMVTLTVTVVTEDGERVGEADLNATWDGGSNTAKTVSNGKAFIDVPRGADVSIHVDHPDYVRNRPKSVENASEEEVRMQVAPKAYLEVRTVTASGEPIDARVIVRESDGDIAVASSADSSGVFQSEAIEEGEYSVVAFDSGYFRNRTTLQVSGNVSTTLSLEQGSATVRFEVRDDHFSPARPVEEAEVTIEEVGSTRTLGNGETTLQVPVNTRVTATITKEGYETVEQTVDVDESSRQVNVTIQRTPALTVTTSNERVVVGERARLEVTNEYGTPVSGATVLLDGEEVGTTDEDGGLSVTIESAGDHQVEARSDGLTSAPVTIRGVVPAGTGTPTPTASPTDTPESNLPSIPQPGFGPAVAVLALLAFALVARLRR